MSDKKPIIANQITMIYGMTQSGKSTYANELVKASGIDRVVWLDPNGGDASDLRGLRDFLIAGDRRIVVGGSQETLLTALCMCAGYSTKEDPIFVVCDEAFFYLNKRTIEADKIVNTGRHAGLGMVLITQRPNAVAPQYRSQAVKFVYFRLIDRIDVDEASKVLGKEQAEKLRSFKPGQHVVHG